MKSINTIAPVTCHKSMLINAPSAKVWDVISNINNWALWQTDIKKASLNGNLQINAPFTWKTGGAIIHSKLHTVNLNQQLGWTGKTFGMYAIHNWTLSEMDGQTQVLVEESMEGWLAAMFKKTFNKNLEEGMIRWLELLKKECEK